MNAGEKQERRDAPALEWRDSIDGVDWDELTALYRAAPLGDKNPKDLATTFGNSLHCCLVYAGGRLVGAGRVLGDGVDTAYLCDVAVMPSHQGGGLGGQIVGRLVDLSRGHRKIFLYAVPGKEGFYARYGFKRMATAMGIFADPEKAVADGYLLADDG